MAPSRRSTEMRAVRMPRDEGSAALEFITKGTILLVPLVFLILPITIVFAIYPGIFVLQLGF